MYFLLTHIIDKCYNKPRLAHLIQIFCMVLAGSPLPTDAAPTHRSVTLLSLYLCHYHRESKSVFYYIEDPKHKIMLNGHKKSVDYTMRRLAVNRLIHFLVVNSFISPVFHQKMYFSLFALLDQFKSNEKHQNEKYRNNFNMREMISYPVYSIHHFLFKVMG